MSLYLDTSVLVALLTQDALSERASRFLQNSTMTLIVSDWAGAEFASALARRFRMGEMTHAFAQRHLAGLDEWVSRAANRVQTSASDVERAALFVRRLELGLRTPDALHVALAQHHRCTIASFDARMIEAAEKLGIKAWTEKPN